MNGKGYLRDMQSKVSAARIRDIESALYWDADRAEKLRALGQVGQVQEVNAARPVRPDDKPGALRVLAEKRASIMMDVVGSAPFIECPRAWCAWLQDKVTPLQGGKLKPEKSAINDQEAVRGLSGRVTDPSWWFKCLKKAAGQMREHEARARGRVGISRGLKQPYITDESMRRKLDQDAANAALLAATELENEDGQVMSLAELSAVSVSNPALRRGELMTRIRGCEELAESLGMVGVFTTQTAPGRFHALHRNSGEINHAWIEAGRPTPRDAQQWLRDAWARARAELDRSGVGFFGFRVAEPHHDGTPHWHGLFFCAPEHAESLVAVIRDKWLNDPVKECKRFKNGPGACHWERGGARYRVQAKMLVKGGAASYIAKYISKGIDDEGHDMQAYGHLDELEGRVVQMEQADMFGGGANRVRAWASLHGIRQFQAIGQPPVTVWRELRRVPEEEAKRASERVESMWRAAQRDGARRACFATYMVRQGGACVGRDYRVQVERMPKESRGRYELVCKPVPVGVLDRIERKQARSNRKEWRPKGQWGTVSARANSQEQRPVKPPSADGGRALAVHPWTRVNNCTHPEAIGAAKVVRTRKVGEVYRWPGRSPGVLGAVSGAAGASKLTG